MTPGERARLERLLETHAPADEEERGHLALIRSFAGRHEDPFRRANPEGHLTGSAFVLDPLGRILLTHHRRLGIWVQLGGHAEDERCAEAVALREAREESGLSDLRFCDALLFPDGGARLLDVDVHRIPARGAEAEHSHLDLRFLLETRRPEAIVADPAETRALEWVTLAQARERCDRGMLRVLGRIEALGLAGP